MLQEDGTLRHIIASYEAVPLLAEYAPRINPQQIKNALLLREECERVRTIIAECRMSAEPLMAGVEKVASCRGSERKRIAARFLRDLFLYHRDLRGLEALNAGLDSINLIGDERVRELSVINGMLYEFLDEPTPESEPANMPAAGGSPRKFSKHTEVMMVRRNSRMIRILVMNSLPLTMLAIAQPISVPS